MTHSILIAGALCGALLPIAVAAEEHELTPAEAGAAFRKNCRGCHTVPDPARELDRAWLDQVNRTA